MTLLCLERTAVETDHSVVLKASHIIPWTMPLTALWLNLSPGPKVPSAGLVLDDKEC